MGSTPQRFHELPIRQAVTQNSKKHTQLFASNMPTTGGFSNNHVMVNMIRNRMGLKALARSRELDKMAKCHVKKMAARAEVVHSVRSLEELGERLGAKVAGENVQRGPTIEIMQKQARSSPSLWKNERFTEFGM